MRKIVIGGLAAALALGLTACGSNGGGAAAAPSSPAGSPPASSEPTQTPTSTPGASTPSEPSAPRSPGAPVVRHTPLAQPGGQQVKSKWGTLQYLAPGKYLVGNIGFFVANDTVLQVAGGTCPDGSAPSDDSKCSIDGLDEWVQAAPHNAVVQFSGQAATLIRETQ
ncbi:hypothetical protein [Actinomadura verrucosospora]|uniref:Secreted protein n=1 Tax=Actinomadura verrucosospora TaxID=46165 RepID=A0A7D3VVT8_ACTVE|nr:hypothetical protein [Actinomadura verrucosospora]QKG23870.1 hypothetical protein ACTIVE_5513 [Actinomadura verrucosospora]